MIKSHRHEQPQAAEDLVEIVELSEEEAAQVSGGPEVQNDPPVK